MNREKTVRDKAYAIWEAEGRPDGRDAEHWQRAEDEISSSGSDKAGSKAEKGATTRTVKSSSEKAPASKGSAAVEKRETKTVTTKSASAKPGRATKGGKGS